MITKLFRKEKETIKPMGVKMGDRPNVDYSTPKTYLKNDDKVDKYFLQELSDILYGPDSDAYIIQLKELNKSFRKRGGKYGNQLYDPSFSEKYKQKEKDIKNIIKDN
jgi:hypothetical protein